MVKNVSEPLRERETLRYDPSLLARAVYNDSAKPASSSGLVASEDTILTALAQLGACRLNTARSFVSLFDQKYQYIVAEATPTLPLVPGLAHDEPHGDLWMCGTAIPREDSVCEYTLRGADSDLFECGDDPSELPFVRVADLTADPRFSSKPYCQPGSLARFYAAVPIQTRRGINIGVYCVIDTEPRNEWDSRNTALMRNISKAIMDHLDSKRARNAHRRNERMIRGLGSFIEGKTTISGWRHGPDVASFESGATQEGALNPIQQSMERSEEDPAPQVAAAGGPVGEQPSPPDSPASEGMPTLALEAQLSKLDYFPNQVPSLAKLGPGKESGSRPSTINEIFSKAANIVRESIEVEGMLFVDASKTPFGEISVRPADPTDITNETSTQSSSSSGDEKPPRAHRDVPGPSCRVVGFSTSDSSSIDGSVHVGLACHATVPEKLLSTLLRRYPKGKIFNFDQDGELQSSDSSEDDRKSTSAPTPDCKTPTRRGENRLGREEMRRPVLRRDTWAKKHEGGAILELFPGSRSVAFVPVWDSKKERWFAGAFAYTYTPARIFTVEGELSYLRAFGTLTMASILNVDLDQANKAKSDILSSVSHELRSPLHGIMLGAELLNDTKLDAFQGNMVHTLETCSRTLLDTIDHLLDYSKINNFMATTKKAGHAPLGTRGLRNSSIKSIDAGMKALYSDVRLDVIVEEVMESVVAGFNFQRISIAQLAKHGSTMHTDVHATRRLDSMLAMEEMGPSQMETGELQVNFENVSVLIDIDPTQSWTFHAQPGAIRRIVMNLVGNSLKYTSQGTIRISLKQEPASRRLRGRDRIVSITCVDTGKGISEDYLRNRLFKPFSQEDDLTPGTGLGLSLIKQIVSQHRGTISVDSRVGFGTTVSASLPLAQVLPSTGGATTAPSEEDKGFEVHVSELRGLRVRLIGFDACKARGAPTGAVDQRADTSGIMESICHGWLHMEVISEVQAQQLVPDLVLCAEDAVGELSVGRETHGAVPTVVVCQNALIAHQRSTSFEFIKRTGIFEFISQPVGPRKLAKILILAFRRWIDQQAYPPTAGEVTSAFPSWSPSSESITTASTSTGSVSIPESQATAASMEPDTEMTLLGSVTPMPPALSTSEARDPISISRPRQDAPRELRPLDAKRMFLIVDDNQINLKILSSYMRKLGHVCEKATDGQQAADAYRRSPDRYACIFMDISMPIMDGFEATRCIRAFERKQRLSPVAIFALSGLASTSAQEEAFGSGIDLFLTKPVRLKELNMILRSRGLL